MCYLKWVLSMQLGQHVKQCIVLSFNGSLWLSSLDLCPSSSFESGYMTFLPEVNAYFSFVFISCCLQSSTEGRCSIYDLQGMWLSQADCLFNKKDRREVHSICLELYKYYLKRGFPHLFHFSLPVQGEL